MRQLREIVRGRLEGLGPVTAAQLAAIVRWKHRRRRRRALLALEAEGTAMRGSFEPDNPAGVIQWCDRRLLARIHRYTVKRLRAEIEPVQARDFLRFLFDWQRVTPEPSHAGTGLGARDPRASCEGFDAPASAWETEILPARIAEYETRVAG